KNRFGIGFRGLILADRSFILAILLPSTQLIFIFRVNKRAEF
ncbi:MAG: hypothetical protein ACI9KM_002679, partial [Rubritalea sp.]